MNRMSLVSYMVETIPYISQDISYNITVEWQKNIPENLLRQTTTVKNAIHLSTGQYHLSNVAFKIRTACKHHLLNIYKKLNKCDSMSLIVQVVRIPFLLSA